MESGEYSVESTCDLLAGGVIRDTQREAAPRAKLKELERARLRGSSGLI